MNILKEPLTIIRLVCHLAIGCTLLSSPVLSGKSNLVKNSPFLPEGWGEKQKPKPKPTPVAPKEPVSQLSREIEFRGVFQIGDSQPKFNIFDKKNQRGFWLSLNEANERFKVTKYNKEAGSITLASGGRSEEISIAKSDGAPMPIQSLQGSNTPPNTPQINNPPQTNSTRKRRVVPRRRIIRRRSSNSRTENVNNTPPPIPQTPPPAPPSPAAP